MTIELYSKPACIQCNQSKKTLDKLGLDYIITDVTEDESAYEFVLSMGFRAAPVLVIKDSDGNILDKWSGFNPEKLNALSDVA